MIDFVGNKETNAFVDVFLNTPGYEIGNWSGVGESFEIVVVENSPPPGASPAPRPTPTPVPAASSGGGGGSIDLATLMLLTFASIFVSTLRSRGARS